MDRLRLEPGALGETFGGTAGWRTERHCDGLREQDLEDGVDQCRLTVLPTPGPPVITSTLETRATRTASRWLSASASFVRCSTQGMALSASIAGQGGFPSASALSFSAISRSAR